MSSNADDRDDERVGYKHPPKHTRWKKGQSGNPQHSKPKLAESLLAIIDRLLLAPMPITLSGEPKTVSALEAIMLQLMQKAMAGSARAYGVLLKYEEFAHCNLEKRLELSFVDSDYTRAVSGPPSDQGA
jgi:hypothetical protein